MRKIIDSYPVIGIIGLSKNSGKTTTMNHLISLCADQKVGVTSIGLDGEDLDQIHHLPKPKIQVKKGMVVATACTCLEASTVAYDILENTDFLTIIGKVKIVRILSEGPMVIAGPTSNHDLDILIQKMRTFVDKLFVDGAFNRMTFSNLKVFDGIVLAAGASYHNDMKRTIQKTKMIVDTFGLSPVDPKDFDAFELIIDTKVGRKSYIRKDPSALEDIFQSVRQIETIYLKGAMTEAFVNQLIKHRMENITIVVEDPSRIMIHEKAYAHLNLLNIKLKIMHRCPLLFVTINPFRPIGASYDAEIFLKAMENEITNIPVYDIVGGDQS